jgi:hypothetical protein
LINQELGKAELYNIESDWAETTDLSAQYPEVVDQLTQQANAWKATLPSEAPASCFSASR